ncbi:ATP-binding cassette domain-containing protein [Collinsella sp. AGMB00827]|uniref:ATP-binding cassette domain-containing protein n=1 Tax=Collinsella ureilytica TaxID=2869515 RepID=A0ABS7MHX2_9ACTN|nr:ATP-binding cassette domain-containing protein [Collinsella urealyticum]MBY4796951.1 ATP-binding cassette domain-containing protein [Collinsella urealyticum]
MQLDLSHVTYTYPLAHMPVLKDVSASFLQGWTGIIGNNGSGKTTLAQLICGYIQPDSGSVTSGLVSSLCTQNATYQPHNLMDFACAYDNRAMTLRRDLHIDVDWCWRFDTLSGGQQKCLQVACALWVAPDVLILDEPTNHVDTVTRQAIIQALSRFRGIGLVISHDRELLNTLCTQCLFIAHGSVCMRPGDYSQAAAQAELERSSAERARGVLRKEKQRLEREVQRRREEASRAAGKRSLRGINPRDSDKRRKVRQAIVTGKDGKAGRLVTRMVGRLEETCDRFSATAVDKRYDADIWFDTLPCRRKVLYRMEPCELSLGDKTLYVPRLFIEHTDHLGLVGDNGTGKTTLIQKIVADLQGSLRMLYIPQEPCESQKSAALNVLKNLSNEARGRVLSYIACLNSSPSSLLEGDAISPGEMRKLMLALGILKKPELIIMDEPTNYLDICSIEALERMLVGYPGALLLVSHDVSLMKAATHKIMRIESYEDGYRLTWDVG